MVVIANANASQSKVEARERLEVAGIAGCVESRKVLGVCLVIPDKQDRIISASLRAAPLQ